jgi:hypothetical protein
MPQSFEINPVGQQGLGFAAGGFLFVNYEDSYAIDRCTGDLLPREHVRAAERVMAPSDLGGRCPRRSSAGG